MNVYIEKDWNIIKLRFEQKRREIEKKSMKIHLGIKHQGIQL